MGNMLSALFDFQKFDGNADLQRVIDATHARYAKHELTIEEMEWVNAAGAPEVLPDRKDPEKNGQ